MLDVKDTWRSLVAEALNRLRDEKGIEAPAILPDELTMELPPKPELGDYGFPMFPFAKLFRLAPAAIAVAVRDAIAANPALASAGKVNAEGPYVNVRIAKEPVIRQIIASVKEAGEAFGSGNSLSGQKIMIEFSSPNTNKPLHLGHLRNDALGESVARVLKAAGAEVMKINLVNDRGVHICKSMLAYKKFGEGKTPEDLGLKSDHFVGTFYVKFASYAKENPEAEEEARELLRRWESGDTEVIELWKKMNAWVFEGMKKTYERTGIAFDRYYYEHETYKKGREQILAGLEKGIFYKEADGSVWIDCAEIGLDKKVLLRSDGTSIYITQDVGTAIARHDDWPFDRIVYVVANEQQYHFKVLFYVLEKLGFAWAKNLFHLAYGMVNLPEGRMKSREGTVVDADDLIDSLRDLSLEEIQAKGREEDLGDAAIVAEKVAIGALHYYLIQATPAKDMIFNPKESLSFSGETGPYLQYMGARICSMLRKFDADPKALARQGRFIPELLTGEDEWEIVKRIAAYPGIVAQAAREMNPALIASTLYELAKLFSRWYHDHPILTDPHPDLAATRLELARTALQVFQNGFKLILVPFLESM